MEINDRLITEVVIDDFAPIKSPMRTVQQVAFLNIATLGIYQYYWFYCNWKDLVGVGLWDDKVNAFLRTIGLLIPIVGLFLAYDFFKRILFSLPIDDRSINVTPGVLTALLFLSSRATIALDKADYFPDWVSLVFPLAISTLVLTLFQPTLNQVHQQNSPVLSIQKSFSLIEKVLICIGGFLWFFILLGYLLPD